MTNDSALILIDFQRDYFPGGARPLPGANRALAAAALVLQQFRSSGRPVFHIRQQSVHPGATFLVAGSSGTDLHPEVAGIPGERVIDKRLPNAFIQTSLEQELRAARIEHLFVAGMMTNMCVDATVRQGKDLAFACTLIEDASAACDLEWRGQKLAADAVHTAFVATLAMGYATMTLAEQVAAR